MKIHTFFGIHFLQTTYTECLDSITSRLKNKEKTIIVTPNPEILYDASYDTKLFSILKKADIALPDGVGIFIGYQIADSRLPRGLKYIALPFWCLRAILHSHHFTRKYGERITGSRLTPDLLSMAVQNNIGVTIIDPIVRGETIGDHLKRTSQKTMQHHIEQRYPGITCNIMIADAVDIIQYPLQPTIQPIVIATHGNKQQEKIIDTLLTYNPDICIGIGAGSSIDLITGFRIPAPAFFRRFGGEWLYRLYKNPKKHSKRIWRVIKFLHLCITQKNY